MDTFKPGDLVELKSGSPPLVVDEIQERHIVVVWHAEGMVRAARVSATSLRPAAPVPPGCYK